MNDFLKEMKKAQNYKLTENGAVAYSSTLNSVLDMFAFGGAYRNRTDEDVWNLFYNAWCEDSDLALKCLFYLRDCRGEGQGERRFFRVVMHNMMCSENEDMRRAVINVIKLIPEYGRWDDLIYAAYETPHWTRAMAIVDEQLFADEMSMKRSSTEGISLLGKWLPSENASSEKTKHVANTVRRELGLTSRQYRKVLSDLRARINVLERLMSAQRWDEIHFDAIPSKAGLKYRNAFAHNEFLAARYEAFMKSKTTKVNAGVLNPVDIAHQIFNAAWHVDQTARDAWQKYWDCLPDYYNGRKENGICVVDVSGSMIGTPMEAAVSLGAYIADKADGPFKNHFITFSGNPTLVEFKGEDIFEKIQRARYADWGGSTNIEGTMDLILDTCKRAHCDMPDRLYIFTDMEFNAACGGYSGYSYGCGNRRSYRNPETLFEGIERKFNQAGYQMPQVVFWNLDARNDTIPAIGGRYSYVSGFNPNMIQCILSGKTGWDLCLEKLLSERYERISSK